MEHHWRDIALWTLLSVIGLAITATAVTQGAHLGTESAPFLGHFRWRVGPVSLLAPLIATVAIISSIRGIPERLPWLAIQMTSFVLSLLWAVSLAVVDGKPGLTRGLTNPDEYLSDVNRIGHTATTFLATFIDVLPTYSSATRGHPPGPVLLLWSLEQVGITNHLVLGLLITTIGALATPLILSAVRYSCGDVAARRYFPIVCLAPYAVWSAVSLDAVVVFLSAALVWAGVRASRRQCSGWQAAAWAFLAGLIIGVAALFSYAAPWLGLSLVFLYFARRRPFLNAATGLGALLPVLGAQLAGFGWVDGLLAAHADYGSRVEPDRSAWWWSGLSLVTLLLAAGPPLIASARKIRNTPAWPFVAGAGIAVVFSVLMGLARGGVEHAWLPFFPWLTVAAVAPERQGGPPTDRPTPLVIVGAVTAIVVEAVLVTTW